MRVMMALAHSVTVMQNGAVIAQPLNGLASPRLKIRPLQPAPPALGIGVAYCKKFLSAATDSFIAAARRGKAT